MNIENALLVEKKRLLPAGHRLTELTASEKAMAAVMQRLDMRITELEMANQNLRAAKSKMDGV